MQNQVKNEVRSVDDMCTTMGFSYKDGLVFGRTLELGITLDNKILFVPRNHEGFIAGRGIAFPSKYGVIGSGFFNIALDYLI